MAQGAVRLVEDAPTFGGNGLNLSGDGRWLYYVGSGGDLRGADLTATPGMHLHTVAPGFATSVNATISIGSSRQSPTGAAALTRAGASSAQTPWMFHWMGGAQPVTQGHDMPHGSSPTFHERGGVLRQSDPDKARTGIGAGAMYSHPFSHPDLFQSVQIVCPPLVQRRYPGGIGPTERIAAIEREIG